jgi:hypothetical protein
VRSTIAGIAKRFVYEGRKAALGRKKHDIVNQLKITQVNVPKKYHESCELAE